jgi:[ribosomal protein S18]-alanine N-acetyltransferase
VVTLRDYQPQDFDRLWQLDQICFPEGISYTRPELRMFLSLRTAFCFVAERNGVTFGFIIVDSRPNSAGYIVTIDVAPEARREGIASTLLNAAEMRLRTAGVKGIRLEVAENNDSAIAFYKGHGFVETGRKHGYYNPRLDALSMKKELS